MLKVPLAIVTRFEKRLAERAIAPRERCDYRKLLRYYVSTGPDCPENAGIERTVAFGNQKEWSIEGS